MDDRGSETDKVDDAFASFKLIRSEMNVVVASISAISRKIHELRDNKLLPELNKLVEGYATLLSFFYTDILLMNLLKDLRSLLHL